MLGDQVSPGPARRNPAPSSPNRGHSTQPTVRKRCQNRLLAVGRSAVAASSAPIRNRPNLFFPPLNPPPDRTVAPQTSRKAFVFRFLTEVLPGAFSTGSAWELCASIVKGAKARRTEMTSFREFRGGEAWGNEAWKAMCRVRESQPLVQCITNFVSMDIMANTLLAAGASPAMVHAVEEITEFTALSNALCINIGTLSPNWIFSMKVAATRANELQKPWVLDPVGVGATRFRTEKCIELIHLKPTVIRGNASEIMAVVGASTGSTKGVDSTQASTDALEAAKELARLAQCVVVVSGAVDLVTDGKRVLGVSNGVALLQRITATGCAVTSLIAAFLSVNPGRPLEAAAFALALFGIAAEIGNERANGPASLRVNMLDALHSLDEAAVTSRIRIAQI